MLPHQAKTDQTFKKFFEDEITRLYRLTHTMSIRIRIQILVFIYQIIKQIDDVTDRFYRTLYELVRWVCGI